MSSGIAYPMPTYIPPLSVFNPLFFPQSFDTTTTSGGGGGFTNIFPNGLTSGNVITMDGGTGGGGGTGAERTITGLSQIEWTDFTSTNPTTITGYMKLNSGVLEIGSNTASSGINVNLLGSSILANGVAIGTGTGNVSTTANNTFLAPATTQSFNSQTVNINGGSLTLQTSANLYPLTITNESTSASDNVLRFRPNPTLSAGKYIFQTFGSGYVDTLTIDNTGLQLIGSPFKSNLNASPNTSQLPNGYSCFYSNSQVPFFAYNNSGSVITQSLSSNRFTFNSNTGLNFTVGGIAKTQWTINSGGPVITIGDYGTGFTFNIYAGVLTNTAYTGSSPLVLNNTFSITNGIATKQPYTETGFPTGFGYCFTPIATTGSPSPMAITSDTGTYLGNINTEYTFTLVGTYNTSPLTFYCISI